MARTGKVTVVGAGFYGSTTAQRLAEYDIFDEVVLTDIVEGKPEGLALDMSQSRPIEGFETKVTGQTTGPAGEGYEAIAGSAIVVITAGLPRKPGMSRMDLIGVNAKIVRSVTEQVVKHAPDAVLIVVSNPLDEMTALAAKVSGFPAHRVIGQAGMLDTARFSYFVAEQARRPGRVGPDAHPRLTRRHHGAGAVGLHGRRQAASRSARRRPTSSSWSTVPVTAGPRSWRCSRPARRTTRHRPPPPGWPRQWPRTAGAVMPVCAWVDGQYGISGVYLGVEAELGREGVRRVVERDLTESERSSLHAAADAVRAKQADVASL